MNSTAYLNADLELCSTDELRALAGALNDGDMFTLHCGHDGGHWSARLETNTAYPEPEPNINAILRAVDALSDSMRRVLAGCTRRQISIGYESGGQPHLVEHSLSAETLRRLAAADVSLTFAIYSTAAET